MSHRFSWVCAVVFILSGSAVNGASDEAELLVPRTEMSDEVFQTLSAAISSFSPTGWSDEELKDVKEVKEKNQSALKRMRKLPWPDLKRLELRKLIDAKNSAHSVTAWCLSGNWHGQIIISPQFETHAVGDYWCREWSPASYDEALGKLLKGEGPGPRPDNSSLSARLDFYFDETTYYPWLISCAVFHHPYEAAYFGKKQQATQLVHTLLNHRPLNETDPFDLPANDPHPFGDVPDAAATVKPKPTEAAITIIYREWAKRSYNRGFEMLSYGDPRKEVIAHWKNCLRLYPDTRYEERLRDLIGELEKQAADDDRLAAAEIGAPERLPIKRRIEYDLDRLPEISGKLFMPPSLRHWPDASDMPQPTKSLVEIGRPAVPGLIGHLKDRRLTRAAWEHYVDGGFISLRCQDAALGCIETILDRTFYKPTRDSLYFSTESPAKRQAVIDDIETWWKNYSKAADPNLPR